MTDILSAGLDAGTAIATILVFFLLQYPKNGGIGSKTIQTWWGNTIMTRTADFRAQALSTPAAGAPFGFVFPRYSSIAFIEADHFFAHAGQTSGSTRAHVFSRERRLFVVLRYPKTRIIYICISISITTKMLLKSVHTLGEGDCLLCVCLAVRLYHNHPCFVRSTVYAPPLSG